MSLTSSCRMFPMIGKGVGPGGSFPLPELCFQKVRRSKQERANTRSTAGSIEPSLLAEITVSWKTQAFVTLLGKFRLCLFTCQEINQSDVFYTTPWVDFVYNSRDKHFVIFSFFSTTNLEIVVLFYWLGPGFDSLKLIQTNGFNMNPYLRLSETKLWCQNVIQNINLMLMTHWECIIW